MSTSTKPKTCAHRGCDCEVSADAVQRQGRAYCSERCADGRGCDHRDCNCGAFPAQRGQQESSESTDESRG
jgi:hypothetical protein